MMKKVLAVVHILVTLAALSLCQLAYMARNTYFRPLPCDVEKGDTQPYYLALKAGESLAGDLYFPALAVMGSGLVLAILVLAKKDK